MTKLKHINTKIYNIRFILKNTGRIMFSNYREFNITLAALAEANSIKLLKKSKYNDISGIIRNEALNLTVYFK